MKKSISLFLGVFALLFALVVPSFAQSGDIHLTAQQATDQFNMHSLMNRTPPDAILVAAYYSSGVTFHADGTYALDMDSFQSGSVWTSTQESVYANIAMASGDQLIAMEAALGLLTPAEEERARNPYANGANALSWFYSPYFNWQSVGGNGSGGGGGMLN